uniref:Uncharacterized protein n=1 Tax=Oncorhynchus kisutch TaxID=8019 RepID=A0A8C7L740_ONCKI
MALSRALYCAYEIQKYKPYSCGVANQKWVWFPDRMVLSAFYTSSLDQEVTAANQASVCVPPVCLQNHCTSMYTRTSPEQLLGRGVLQKPPPGSSSLCCMASHNHQLSPTGHFRILKTSVWESLRTEAAVLQKQTPSPEVCSAAQTKPSVKLLAHRNGQGGLEEGQLITVATMPLLLSECTRLLQLTRTVFQVSAEDMSSVDEGLLALILRSPIHVWVSCGEPYLPSDGEMHAHTHTHTHTMVPGQASLVPTQSPARPVVDEQSWLQPSHEELTLDQELHNTEVWRYLLHNKITILALVFSYYCSTVRLALSRSAPRLYAADGRLLSSCVDIHRDMLLCVSTGQPFISPEGQQIEMRATFARMMRSLDSGNTTTDRGPKEHLTTTVRGEGITVPGHYATNGYIDDSYLCTIFFRFHEAAILSIGLQKHRTATKQLYHA